MKLPKDDVERIIMDFPECRDTILNSSELICNKVDCQRSEKEAPFKWDKSKQFAYFGYKCLHPSNEHIIIPHKNEREKPLKQLICLI